MVIKFIEVDYKDLVIGQTYFDIDPNDTLATCMKFVKEDKRQHFEYAGGHNSYGQEFSFSKIDDLKFYKASDECLILLDYFGGSIPDSLIPEYFRKSDTFYDDISVFIKWNHNGITMLLIKCTLNDCNGKSTFEVDMVGKGYEIVIENNGSDVPTSVLFTRRKYEKLIIKVIF